MKKFNTLKFLTATAVSAFCMLAITEPAQAFHGGVVIGIGGPAYVGYPVAYPAYGYAYPAPYPYPYYPAPVAYAPPPGYAVAPPPGYAASYPYPQQPAYAPAPYQGR